ncbi:MAG TPA: UDP-N-acetylmuramoyl-L-alanyl-D-glutamate--2,6-diaminopimelate ligase [Solirubrobacteraceae bacterium]|nr:UDP-N-acetylmuramoyl-L-alanyl-D-glutamate--2,6-diaminopimelate ligase [Solirubrobacteraceae bacterium]
MRLAELAPASALGAGGETEITALAYDSRAVRAGGLFFCVSGYERDGHDYARQALAAGAAALVVERELALDVPQVLVESVRAAMGPIAARFNGDPTARLRVVGVTGTNGKTTTAFLVRALVQAAGEQCGLMGTVKSIVGGEERAVTHTTPEAIDLQAEFRAMLDGGDRACAMEVSSHALELARVDGVRFAAAMFTNLTQDHLDFHETMEDYFQAKRKLFAGAGEQLNVINTGDPYGRRLASELGGAVTFAVDEPADYRATDVQESFEGCRFTLHTPGAQARELALPMPGRFNVANALGALAAVHALGVAELDVLVGALEHGVRVPGRFEPVEEGQAFAVLVDYAHTPDSLENVLRAARELTRDEDHHSGRLLCVFGAGGDRDRAKRPLMGEIGARLADVLIVTSDNPRSEDPQLIIDQIMEGCARATRAHAAPPVRALADRRAAIEQAVGYARAGDVLVIAGKGHEQGQELAGGVKVAFDDVTVARDALRARMAAAKLAP